MKRVLSLVLVLVMVLSAIVPAFAEETASQEALDLETYGLITGNGTDLDEASPLTRAEMTVILAKLYGKATEAEAYDIPNTLTDIEGHWAVAWISYSFDNEWMVGDEAGTFRPDETISAQEVNTLMLKVLGYFNSWETANEDAATQGVAVDAADASLVIRGEIFKTLRGALDMPKKDSTDTLGTELALDGYTAPVVEPTTLVVNTVEAPNARQVVLTFNKDVDAASVKAATVKVYVGTATATTAWTSTVDGAVVTLGLAADVAQDTAVKVVVDGVTAGEEKVEDYEMTVTMKDLVNPVVLNANATTSKTFVIETSEPLKIETAEESYHVMAKVLINDVALVGKFTQDLDANTITVELGTKLAVGDHTVKVTGVKDIVGFKAADFTGTITVVEDTTTPTVTAVEFVDVDTIKVTFDEPVATAGTFTVDGNGTTLGTLSADKMTQTVNLGTSLGLASIVKATLSYNGTVDMEGNTISTAKTFDFVATDDIVAPTATLSITAANKVKVVFSETVSAAGTLTVKNSAGTAVAVGALSLDATDTTNKTYLSANAVSAVVGTFTAELKDSADNGVRANKIVTFSESLTTNDITAPTIEQVVTKTAYAAGPPVVNGQAKIYFSEALDATTATTLTNYMIDLDGAGANAAVQLSSITGGAAALSADGKVVTLTIPGATYAAGTSTVAVLAVKDAAGNLIDTADFNVAQTIAATAPTLTESGFEMVAKNKIKVTFTNPLVAVDPSDFVVQDGSTSPDTALAHLVGVAYELDATNKIATITLSGNLTVDGMIVGDNEKAELVITAGNTKDIYGTASAEAATDLVDKVAPSIKSVKVKADDHTGHDIIVLEFDEAVYADVTVDTALDADLKIMVGTTQLAVGEYAAANAAGKIEVTVTKAIDSKVTVELLNNRYVADDTDANATFNTTDNAATVFAAMTVKNAAGTADFVVDTTAPAESIPAATGTNNNATKLVITLDEALYTVAGHVAVADGADLVAHVTNAGTGTVSDAIYDATALTITCTLATSTNADIITFAASNYEDVFRNVMSNETWDYTAVGTIWAEN